MMNQDDQERTRLLLRCPTALRRELEILAEANFCSVNQYSLRILSDHVVRARGNQDVLPITPELV